MGLSDRGLPSPPAKRGGGGTGGRLPGEPPTGTRGASRAPRPPPAAALPSLPSPGAPCEKGFFFFHISRVIKHFPGGGGGSRRSHLGGALKDPDKATGTALPHLQPPWEDGADPMHPKKTHSTWGGGPNLTGGVLTTPGGS